MRPEDHIEFLLTRAEFAEEKAHTVNDHLARFTWELISEGYRHLAGIRRRQRMATDGCHSEGRDAVEGAAIAVQSSS